jgi:drug/metabolite transporter (DMT)-like permease
MTAPNVVVGRRNAPLAAFAWMGGALISFTCVAIAGREASRVLDTWQLMAWRGLFSIVLVSVVAVLIGRTRETMATRQLGLHVGRGIIHFGAQFSWLHALPLIPLAQLFALEFTSPLWVALLAPFILGERLTSWRIIAAVIGFAGAMIVVQPGTGVAAGLSIGRGEAFALLSAVGFAISMICTKKLTRQDDSFRILFYMIAVQAVMALVVVAWRGLIVPPVPTLLWAFAIAVAGLTAHFSLAQAFQRADAIVVAPMDFLRLPLVALVGVVLYQERLNPWVLVGAAVVVFANLLNMWTEQRARS